MDKLLYVVNKYWSDDVDVITTISKDDIEYLYKLLHEKLDDEGVWSVQEENTLDLIDLLYDNLSKD